MNEKESEKKISDVPEVFDKFPTRTVSFDKRETIE